MQQRKFLTREEMLAYLYGCEDTLAEYSKIFEEQRLEMVKLAKSVEGLKRGEKVLASDGNLHVGRSGEGEEEEVAPVTVPGTDSVN